MNTHALERIAQALDLSAVDVLELHDAAELLPLLLAEHILLRRGQTTQHDDDGARFCRAVHVAWGDRPFLAAELIAWAEQEATTEQREVLAAARALCQLHGDADLTAQCLGMRLRALAAPPTGAGVQIAACGDRRGSALWAVRDLRG